MRVTQPFVCKSRCDACEGICKRRMPREFTSNASSLKRVSLGVCIGALFCFLGGFRARPARAQISPGPLSKAHQALSGPTNCTKCHDLARGAAQLKCLECHTEIRERVTQRRGMHAVWVNANGTGQDCARCHSDHSGGEFT